MNCSNFDQDELNDCRPVVFSLYFYKTHTCTIFLFYFCWNAIFLISSNQEQTILKKLQILLYCIELHPYLEQLEAKDNDCDVLIWLLVISYPYTVLFFFDIFRTSLNYCISMTSWTSLHYCLVDNSETLL